MKKNHILFTLMLIMSAMWTTSSAWVWKASSSQKTDFKNGDLIVIVGENSTWWEGSNYANAYENASPAALETCVIELEATGEKGLIKNYNTYYLKQHSTGLYYGSGSLKTKKEDAYKYEILVNSPEKDKNATIIQGDKVNNFITETRDVHNPTDESVVFAVCTKGSDGKISTSFLGNYKPKITHWAYFDTNTWKVYGIEKEDNPITELNNLLIYYKDALKKTYTSDSSNNPGYYQNEATLRYNAAYNAADEAVTTENEEACRSIIGELKSARANVDTLFIPITEGYYIIRSAYPDFFTKQQEDKAMFIDMADSRIKWKGLDKKSPFFMFYIKKTGDGTNYTVQNMGTETYFEQAEKATTASPVTAQTFKSLNEGQWNIANTVEATAYHTQSHSSGAGKSGNVTFYSGGLNTGSSWFLDKVTDQHIIDSLIQVATPIKLNQKMKTLLATAKSTYAKGWVENKLITEATQFYSNAKQSSEGSYAALLDGDPATFFHSQWNGEGPKEYHYLRVALKEPISEFQFYTKMRNNNNRPDSIIVYATNDTTTWNKIAVLPNTNDTLPYASTTPDFNSSLMTLDQSYKYFRFLVTSTAIGGKPHQGYYQSEKNQLNGYPYFSYAEFQMYGKEKYNAVSQNFQIQNADMLKKAIAVADTIKSATEEQLATLQAAINAYNSEFSDTTLMAQEITSAQTMVDNTEIGTEMGKATQEGLDQLIEAVAVAKTVKMINPTTGNIILRADLDAAIANLKAAKKALAATVVTIVPGKWYYILNRMLMSEASTRFDGGISATEGKLNWGGNVNTNFSKENDAAYIWRFVQMTDSTYAVQNFATGQYMAATTGASVQVKQSSTPVPYFVEYFGAAQFGIIPNIEDDPLPLHAAAGNTVVGWQNGANSASAWTFEEAIPSDLDSKTVELNSISVVTLPYEYTIADLYYYKDEEGIVDEGIEAYSIVGKVVENNETKGIKLHKYSEDDLIPAGTPIIVVIGDPADYDASAPKRALIYSMAGSFNSEDPSENVDVVDTPLSANGLVGVFNDVALPHDGVGLLESGKLRVVKATEITSFLSGYILESQITEISDLSVDKTLMVGEGPALDIEGVTGDKTNKNGNIYTTDGVYAGSTVTGLKPGLYIINGKVVRL